MLALDDLDRVVRVGLLFDFYAPLLTSHQREVIDLYFLQNWSLQEIAETWKTSRQAVHDLINRTVHLLEDYEAKLGLWVREQERRTVLKSCAERLEEAEKTLARDPAQATAIMQETAKRLRDLLEAI